MGRFSLIAVERQNINRVSSGVRVPFTAVSKLGHIQSLTRRPSSLRCVNQYLATNCDDNEIQSSLSGPTVCLVCIPLDNRTAILRFLMIPHFERVPRHVEQLIVRDFYIIMGFKRS